LSSNKRWAMVKVLVIFKRWREKIHAFFLGNLRDDQC